MIRRFDHRCASRTSALAPILQRLALRDEEHAPLATLAGILALILSLWGVEHVRLAFANVSLASDQARLAASDRDVAATKRLDTEVQDERHLAAEIAHVQASGVLCVNEITAIGNRLPADTWISAIRHDASAVELEGQARHVDAVGAALMALESRDTHSVPSLISIDEGSDTHGIVRYSLRLEAAEK